VVIGIDGSDSTVPTDVNGLHVVDANAVAALTSLLSTLQGTLHVADFSAALTVQARGGVDATTNSNPLVAQNTARAKVDVLNAGTSRIWLGVGGPAQQGVGHFLDPGGYFSEFTTERIEVLDPTGGNRVTYVEWMT
jgi:hypothetical protein